MTLGSEIASLLLLAAAGWFWQQALRSKEIARSAGKLACERVGVQLLDDTVELTRLRWRRDPAGVLRAYRHYRFEFTADGSHRFRGELALLGRRVLFVELEPHLLH